MGIVNATPDSFSDAGLHQTLEERVALGRAACWPRALRSSTSAVSPASPTVRRSQPDEEIERVVPLIRLVSGQLGAIVSVDTYKPAVAQAAIEAGASIVNDVSGLRDPRLAEVCAATGAALVIMHTRAAPKQKLLDPALDGRVAEDVLAFLRERIEVAMGRGVAFEQLMLDPGPDFAKTPSQTVEVLRALPDLHALGRPVLLAVSRKDFVGAITHRAPRERLAGTLAAVAHGISSGAHVLRVHDVAETADFMAVRAVLSGEQRLGSEARVEDSLRWAQTRTSVHDAQAEASGRR